MKNIRFLSLLLIICFGLTLSVSAQTQISGIITSGDDGETVPGASISIKGAQTGTVSDMDGKYTIAVENDESILVFQFIGYDAHETKTNGRTTIDVILKQSPYSIEEVVAIGYGSVTRSDLTGAVGKADVSEMLIAPVKTFDEALGGRVAGVQVTSSQGKPGGAVDVVIRGGNSLTQDNSPLYVIDGFEVSDPENAVIDPANIESIDILKDASATAIYGANGANGVIIITTKKGQEGPVKIQYDGYYGFQEVTNRLDLLDPYEFVSLQQEMEPTYVDTTYLRGRSLESYKDEEGYNWQDEVLRTAKIQKHFLSISGGTKNTRYDVTLSAYNQEGVLLNSGYDSYQGKLRLDQNITDKFRVGINVSYLNSETYGTNPTEGEHTASTYLLYSIWGYRPVAATDIDLRKEAFDPTIDVNNDYRFNPYLSVLNEHRVNTRDQINFNSYLNYKFNKHLSLRITGIIGKDFRRNEAFNNSNTRYGNPLRPEGVNGKVTNYEYAKWQNDNLLNYNNQFGSHVIKLLGGFSHKGTKYSNFGATAISVPFENLGISGIDEGTPNNITSELSEWRMMSFLSRAMYSYRLRYYLTVSYRADGSSKFLNDNKWSYFPSASFAWKVSEENFMRAVDPISNLKFRLGWGQTGNNRVSDYAAVASLGATDPYTHLPLSYGFNNTINQGVHVSSLRNEDLKWETTDQINLGLDMGFLKDRLQITTDYYKKITNDLLLDAELPTSSGFSKAYKNVGKMSNTGYELSITSVNIKKNDFTWTSNFNISFNKNKVEELSENQESMLATVYWDQNYQYTPAYIAKKGQPIGQIYGFIWDGNYQYEDFDTDLSTGEYVLKETVPNNGNARGTIQPGHVKYKDINGDGEVNDYDRTIIGNTLPKHIGGFSNTFSYKGIDLNAFFQWSYGNDILNANRLVMEEITKTRTNQFSTVTDRWTPENQSNTMFSVNGKGPDVYSSRVVEDGSFLRLKTLSIGYSLPNRIVSKIRLTKLRINITAQNILTWTKYSGYDPEVNSKRSPLTPGFDYSTYPRAKTVTAGLNIIF